MSALLRLTCLTVLLQIGFVPSSNCLHMHQRLGERVVQTKHGAVRGTLASFSRNQLLSLRPVERYFGLQYASVANLRFMPPTSPPPYVGGIKIADRYGPVCPQRRVSLEEMHNLYTEPLVRYYRRHIPYVGKSQDEDCLYLNIFVPQRGSPKKKYAILLFIHGESYSFGTGNAYDGGVLATYGEVMVITLNYRLGVLGFLSTGDGIAPGNYGLLDIIAAIDWIKVNIAAFRGDPDKITLFGQGYGAALVNILLVSPMASGNLFKGAIMQSGTALSPWAFTFDPRVCLRQFAKQFRCDVHIGHNHTALMRCLNNVSWNDVINADIHPPKYRTCFGPVKHPKSGVIPKPMKDLYTMSESYRFTHPVVVGVTRYDGTPWIHRGDLFQKISQARRSQIMRTFVNNIFKYNRQKIYVDMDYRYRDWRSPFIHSDNHNAIINMISDVMYVVPAIDVARRHAKASQTYFYFFNPSGGESKKNNTFGDYQGDDLAYVFGEPLLTKISPYKTVYTESEKELSRKIMTYWSNFAKSGNPNKEKDNSKHSEWPKYDSFRGFYIQLAAFSGIKNVRSHYRNNKVAFWIRRIRQILRNASDKSDPYVHLLNASGNMSLFDEPRRLINYELLSQLALSEIATPSSSKPYNFVLSDFTTLGSGRAPVRHNFVTAEGSLDTSGLGDHLSNPRVPNNSSIRYYNTTSKNSVISLKITIAIGLTLLFLNTFAFIGIYYQKRRVKQLYRCNNQRNRANSETSRQKPDFNAEHHKQSFGLINTANYSKSKPKLTTHTTGGRVSPTMARQCHIDAGDYATVKTLPIRQSKRADLQFTANSIVR